MHDRLGYRRENVDRHVGHEVDDRQRQKEQQPADDRHPARLRAVVAWCPPRRRCGSEVAWSRRCAAIGIFPRATAARIPTRSRWSAAAHRRSAARDDVEQQLLLVGLARVVGVVGVVDAEALRRRRATGREGCAGGGSAKATASKVATYALLLRDRLRIVVAIAVEDDGDPTRTTPPTIIHAMPSRILRSPARAAGARGAAAGAGRRPITVDAAGQGSSPPRRRGSGTQARTHLSDLPPLPWNPDAARAASRWASGLVAGVATKTPYSPPSAAMCARVASGRAIGNRWRLNPVFVPCPALTMARMIAGLNVMGLAVEHGAIPTGFAVYCGWPSSGAVGSCPPLAVHTAPTTGCAVHGRAC